MSDILVIDIETIPQQTTMTSKQKELYKKLMLTQIKKLNETSISISELRKIRGLVMSTNPYLGEIIVIGLYRDKDGNKGSIGLTGTEPEILKRFWNTVETFKGQIVTFNGLEFDIPFIVSISDSNGGILPSRFSKGINLSV